MNKDSIYYIGVPKSSERDIQKNLQSALKNARQKLKYTKPVGVAIFEAQSEMVIPEIGMAGSAIGKSGIEIRIDFKRKFAKQKFANELTSSIYHELAHLVREDTTGNNITLLDAMTNEGIACFVEYIFLPKHRTPYISEIKNEKKFLEKAVPLFSEKNFNHSEWFFGSGKIPRWFGYRLGFLIIDGYAKNNKISLPDLVRTQSKELLRGSGLV